jgi:hypothetical protein
VVSDTFGSNVVGALGFSDLNLADLKLAELIRGARSIVCWTRFSSLCYNVIRTKYIASTYTEYFPSTSYYEMTGRTLLHTHHSISQIINSFCRATIMPYTSVPEYQHHFPSHKSCLRPQPQPISISPLSCPSPSQLSHAPLSPNDPPPNPPSKPSPPAFSTIPSFPSHNLCTSFPNSTAHIATHSTCENLFPEHARWPCV